MRERVDSYVLYLVLQVGMAVFLELAYTTSTVYWVTVGRLNPLQLVLLGTCLPSGS
ncbi:MAG TPA: hypothetical protein VHV74_24600 [Pseudonocardiaceae bacterium]|nr:hypothetical protein [Pseudonocardiaceae bacterium]